MKDQLTSKADTITCDKCDVDVMHIGEYQYMVNHAIWRAAGSDRILCVGCLESRLGRRLTAADFSHVPVNKCFSDDERSARLHDRLSGKVYLSLYRLPRARLLRRYLRDLQIRVNVTTAPRQAPRDIHCRVRITRDANSWNAIVWTGSTHGESAVEAIISIARSYRQWKHVPHMRRRAGKSALLIRELFTTTELALFERFCSLPACDEQLARNDACGLLGFRALLADLNGQPVERWPLERALRAHVAGTWSVPELSEASQVPLNP